MENLVAELRKLTSNFAKLESELATSKNITTDLSGKLFQNERQCRTNAQYSRRERVKIVRIPSSVERWSFNCKIIQKEGLQAGINGQKWLEKR